MALSEFRLGLAKFLPDNFSRPFLCQGSPLESLVFIVGSNSARTVEKEFWSFWSDADGFDKEAFIKELDKQGRTSTRRNIEIVANTAGQLITLDTNVYLTPSPTERESAKNDDETKVLDYLLQTIKPLVILAHGLEARKFFKRHFGIFVEENLTAYKVTWQPWHWQFYLLGSPHLGFRTKTAEYAETQAIKIGHALKAKYIGAE